MTKGLPVGRCDVCNQHVTHLYCYVSFKKQGSVIKKGLSVTHPLCKDISDRFCVGNNGENWDWSSHAASYLREYRFEEFSEQKRFHDVVSNTAIAYKHEGGK